MSRSQRKDSVKPKSPVKHYFNFNGSTGVFSYWNGQENVTVESLDFMLLDMRKCVSGWSDLHNTKIYSNLVKNMKSELVVRAGSEVIVKGLYNDVKETIHAAGGNLAVNIFCLALMDGEWKLSCIQLDKGCLYEWSEFVNKENLFKLYDRVIHTEKGPQQKKGAIKYFTTSFSSREASEEELGLADIVDKTELQPYFNGVVTTKEESDEPNLEEVPF